MNEAKRFLRYVGPGVVMTVEILLYLFILSQTFSESQRQHFYYELGKLSSNGGIVASAVVGIGGLGYLLGVIYNALLWTCLFNFFAVNHSSLLEKAQKKSYIKFCDCEERINCSRRESWCIVTAIWHARLGSSTMLKSAKERTSDMSDILHGIGTSCIGSICAFIISIWLYHSISGNWTYRCYNYIAPLLIIVLHFICYYFTAKNLQRVVDIIFMDELYTEHEKRKTAMIVDLR